MYRKLNIFVLLAVLTTLMGLVGSSQSPQPVYGQGPDPIAAGLNYLRQTQLGDGSWSSSVGITSLAALAFLNSAYDESDPTVSDSIQYILIYAQPDGSIYGTHPTYETSLALMALKATRAHLDARAAAANWLSNSQWDNSCMWNDCPITEDDWRWGGFGYGNHSRPDQSNGQFALLALHAADWHRKNPMWTKAAKFISRCQNRTASNDGFQPGDDGGFIYHPAYSPAGGTTSYGSMTGAGIWGLALAGLKPTEPRFAAALDWAEDNYSWDYHPLTGGSWGNNYLYYYYLSMSKALSMAYKESVTVNGVNRDWYYELRAKLVSLQRPDGSWANSTGAETNPDLATAFALLALQHQELPPHADLEQVIILHSPADLHLYDAQGRHTGKNYGTGGIDEDIPSSNFSTNSSQTITVTPPVAGNYHIKMVGTGEGEWELEIIGTWDGVQMSYYSYTGTITTGQVLATDLNVGAFVGPLTIFSTQPAEAPVMSVEPDVLSLVGQPGETLQAWFTITETAGTAAPIQKISILAPDLTSSEGVTIPLTITPTSIASIESGQTVSLTIPLATNLPVGEYTGSVVVESVNSGARAVQLTVRVSMPVGGHTYIWSPPMMASQGTSAIPGALPDGATSHRNHCLQSWRYGRRHIRHHHRAIYPYHR